MPPARAWPHQLAGLQPSRVQTRDQGGGGGEILIKLSSTSKSNELLQNIKTHFRSKLRVVPELEFHEKSYVDKLRFSKISRKPIKFIDKRMNNI